MWQLLVELKAWRNRRDVYESLRYKQLQLWKVTYFSINIIEVFTFMQRDHIEWLIQECEF